MPAVTPTKRVMEVDSSLASAAQVSPAKQQLFAPANKTVMKVAKLTENATLPTKGNNYCSVYDQWVI